MNLKRVSKKEPCAACGKDSWCMFSDEAALCMRMQSQDTFIFRNGDTGWWHSTGLPRRGWTPERKEIKEAPTIDADAMMAYWRASTNSDWVDKMADNLGVNREAVHRLGVAWSPKWQSWAWPMTDGNGSVCGIRLRYDSGKKLAVTGSKQGLFIPKMGASYRVFMPEGPTDTAALLSLGVFAIGRPSSSGGLLAIKETINRLHIREVVIVADNDEDKEHNGHKFNPGYDGARALQNHLQIPSCVVALPTKDAREFVKDGGSKDMLEYIAGQAVWENPS